MLLGNPDLSGYSGKELRRILVSKFLRQVLRHGPVASRIHVLGKSYHALLSLLPSKYKECYRNILQNELYKADIKPNKEKIN